MTKKAAVIKGDGTGPELVNAMLHVLKECNTQIELVLCEAGSEQWEKHGGQTYIPEETQKIMDESDACYKGPTTTIPSPDAPRSVAVSTRQKFAGQQTKGCCSKTPSRLRAILWRLVFLARRMDRPCLTSP